MKSISVKIPTLIQLSKAFRDVLVVDGGNGTYVSFGNGSTVDLTDLGKTASLKFSPEEEWSWCVGENSFTKLDNDDLRILFPKRKFKTPRQSVDVGCNSINLDSNLNIMVGSHTCTEEEITGIEELLAVRREMKN